MEPIRQPAPLIVIVGPTASGKSALAMELAGNYGGELIAADSRTIYRGMDIGTAKPDHADQARVRHRLIDLIEPDAVFTAADFKQLALLAMDAICDAGKLPIIVGGTGLYIDGLIFDFAFRPPADPEEREQLQRLSIAELQQKLKEEGIPLPENDSNPRHLIRAIETNGAVAIKKGLRANTLVIGMDIERKDLEERVARRVEAMMVAGLEEEVRLLSEKYGWEAPGLSAVGYREWQGYFAGEYDLTQVKYKIQASTMQYAKRQRTWFKRNSHIVWVKNSLEADALVKNFLR